MSNANKENEECSIYFVLKGAFYAVENALPTVLMPLHNRLSVRAEKLM
jgi:hypothetical protein